MNQSDADSHSICLQGSENACKVRTALTTTHTHMYANIRVFVLPCHSFLPFQFLIEIVLKCSIIARGFTSTQAVKIMLLSSTHIVAQVSVFATCGVRAWNAMLRVHSTRMFACFHCLVQNWQAGTQTQTLALVLCGCILRRFVTLCFTRRWVCVLTLSALLGFDLAPMSLSAAYRRCVGLKW